VNGTEMAKVGMPEAQAPSSPSHATRGQMIIPKPHRLSPEQEAELRQVTAEFGIDLQPIVGHQRTIFAMVGDERHELLITRVEGLPYVDRVDRIQSPYKLMNRSGELSHHRVHVGEHMLGNGSFKIMAGPCTIDPKNPQLLLETAHAVKEAGAIALRGGVWKPRTSPHAYQGDAKAMEYLVRAREETGLPIVTEVMEPEHVELAMEARVDVLQVGARNALNYSLLKAIGKAIKDRPTGVLLKRSIHSGPMNEFVLAAEYIVAQGNPNVMLCPRGTNPTVDGFRNHPDESITVLLKQKTWAPVVVDPSHSVGKAPYVPFAVLAAAAYGADGAIVETHLEPKRGIGDDPKQAITPKVLAKIVEDTQTIYGMQHRYEEELRELMQGGH